MKVIDGKPEYKGAVVSRICYMITQWSVCIFG